MRKVGAMVAAMVLMLVVLGAFLFRGTPPAAAVYTTAGAAKLLAGREFVPGEIIVRYARNPHQLQAAAEQRQKRAQSLLGQISNRIEDLTLQLAGKRPPEELLAQMQRVERELDIIAKRNLARNFFLLKAGRQISPGFFLSRYGSLGIVSSVQPNYLYSLMAVPNDAYYDKLWGMQRMGMEKAWDVTTGSKAIIAAIVDSEIDPNHEDLKENMVEFKAFVDCHGTYSLGHGTHTSGIVGASGNNNQGVPGVNWQVGLLGVNVSCGRGIESSYVRAGINYAVAKGARVINLSLGGKGTDPAMKEAIANANQHGVVVVASAGNSGTGDADLIYPANDPVVITVSATGPQDELATYSSYGKSVDVAAPGGNAPGGSGNCRRDATDCILSTVPNNHYGLMEGTSMAAPQVTGLVALILAKNPQLTVDEVKQIIYSTADDLGPAGKDIRFGHGRVNAAAALAAAAGGAGGGAEGTTPTPTISPSPPPTGKTQEFVGDAGDSTIIGHANGDNYTTARSTSSEYTTSATDFDGPVTLDPAYSPQPLGQGKAPPDAQGHPGGYDVMRQFLRFDTSGIDASAEIKAVRLRLTAVVGGNSLERDYDVEIGKYNWSAQDPVDSNNREAAFDGCLAAPLDAVWRNTAEIESKQPYESPPLDPSWVNKDGFTYYCLRSRQDEENIAPAGGEVLFTYHSDYTEQPAYRPVLVVEYADNAVPPSPPPSPPPSSVPTLPPTPTGQKKACSAPPPPPQNLQAEAAACAPAGEQVAVKLTWEEVAEAVTYRVEVFSDAGLTKKVAEAEAAGGGVVVRLGAGNWYWRVRAQNDCGAGEWSIYAAEVGAAELFGEACYQFYGNYPCSDNYPYPVFNTKLGGGGGPLACLPGNWQAKPSFCLAAAGKPYLSKLQFNSCNNTPSAGKSLWEGCMAATPPPSPPPSPPPLQPSLPPAATMTPPPAKVEPQPVVIKQCNQEKPPPARGECLPGGDYNQDGTIDNGDFGQWREDFLAGKTGLTCFEYWRRAGFIGGGGGPTAPAAEPTAGDMPPESGEQHSAALKRFNYHRRFAGAPPLSEDLSLSQRTQLHANYCAVNNELTHIEEVGKPGYTEAGAQAGQESNGCGGMASLVDCVDLLMMDLLHRYNMLHPKLMQTGFGFVGGYGFINVLSATGGSFGDWPVIYPGAGQEGVPIAGYYDGTVKNCFNGSDGTPIEFAPQATGFPISLQFDWWSNPPPTLSKASLAQAAQGQTATPVAFVYCLPESDGFASMIALLPRQQLAPGKEYKVAVEGNYAAGNFSRSWSFTTAE